MRRFHRALVFVGTVGLGAALSAGCIDFTAEYVTTLIHTIHVDGGGGSGGSGGGDGGPPPSCIPSLSTKPVAQSCGVFVSSASGDDTSGKGTPAAPYKTIGRALQKGGTTIYACAGVNAYSEAVTLETAVTLFGALDCGTWAYEAAKKTQLTAAADAIPMMLMGSAAGAGIHDFAITAADAIKSGGSSIALLDDGAEVTLQNVDITAGVGRAGSAGAPQTQVPTPTSAKGSDGGDNAACTLTTNIPGGAGGTNTCGATKTDGGNGGKGLPASSGDDGGDGQPTGVSNGGAGQTKTIQCQPGQQGTQGGTGMPGTGARGVGDLSASGYQGAAATLGGSGMPGQGGGGGGGALACDMPTNMFAGPSGGGGGAGGCGGAPGNLGLSGGGSIGILALSAKLTLTTVTITTKGGGAGGLGGNGQKGAAGGLEGHAVAVGACSGGPGGQGGAGGPGGGGAGGHSIAVAIKGGTLPDLKSTTVKHGSGGSGGVGGDMDMTMQTKGDDGLGCKMLDFTNPMSPTACAM
jgi:hypothetical protein